MFKVKPNVSDGIFTFAMSDKVTKTVTDFYDIAPFPNYQKDEDKSSPSIDINEILIKFTNSLEGRGSYISRILIQLKMIFTRLGGEGGLFIMIGKKS